MKYIVHFRDNKPMEVQADDYHAESGVIYFLDYNVSGQPLGSSILIKAFKDFSFIEQVEE